ncbi:MAG: UvrD-helicase domain-containing protein [Pseudomonadota bacterium]
MEQSTLPAGAQAYEINGRAADALSFTAAACDPQYSVVVDACAGSGKTWLLVARMLRLLLNGAEPAELLAITFTRKAAQEMRWRLMELLHELALADTTTAGNLLRERGVNEEDLALLIPKSQRLYDKLLASTQGLAMDTFHSWFGRLIQLAPLTSGVPHGFNLLEATTELQREAYGQLMQSLKDPGNSEIKEALLHLYQEIGDFNAKKMLDAFLDKRAEWWAANEDTQDGTPIDWLQDLCGADASFDARLSLWQDAAFCERISEIAQCLGQGTATNQKRAVAIETALSAGSNLESFAALAHEFFGADGKNRSNLKTKNLLAAIEKWLGPDNALAFDDECNAIAEAIKLLIRRSSEKFVLSLNQALFTVGAAYLECYQNLKTDQRVFDFADLEWQAYRLLNNEEFAAYLHARLDARYKHILLDEFQDTNPLQWSIVSAWLAAYGDDASRPSVFIVGDPKQSIYRFRRAEPRVFLAARDLLLSHGAHVLRTNQTRRNSVEIIELLNQSMLGNPIYARQTTAAQVQGDVWRLPLIKTESDATTSRQSKFPLRDPLTTPVEEQEDLRRLEEGRLVAKALHSAKSQFRQQGSVKALKWSDVMLLVRRRSHLSSYEKALREAGIPFVSSRRGGLLDALEVADMIALLTFLITPGDNRALAHILKSPIFGANDQDLIALAQRDESSWWKRMIAAVELANSGSALCRAAKLLQVWMQAAHDLPVHDLIDSILHQGELFARYAQAASASDRAQVIGNLTAFTELALNMDAGRYPSLPKFIAALSVFKQGADADAPDESSVDSATDAVRILTIHSAKGLEAEIVVMLDSNHSEAAKDQTGILCQWPLQKNEKKHFSVFGRKDQRGAARDALFALEEAQAKQENWNMLYVAVTRAKQLLILSGVASDKSADVDGVSKEGWYARFGMLDEVLLSDDSYASDELAEECFAMPLFCPPDLRLPEIELIAQSSPEQLEGIALHALMERLTNQVQCWPLRVPEIEAITAWLPCSSSTAATIRQHAMNILGNKQLEQYFNPARFTYARNEMDILYQQMLVRLDRVVVLENEVWVLDYKRQLLASERDAYQEQLKGYSDALMSIFSGKKIRAALILSNGALIEMP